EHVERRDSDTRLAAREGEPLHGAEANAQAGEGAWPRRHCEQVDRGRIELLSPQQPLDGGKHPARVAGLAHRALLGEDPGAAGERDARARRRGVDGEHAHGLAYTPRSPMSSPALSVTPAMQQYHRMKAEHPDALVFFRMGDFYELFYEDAVTAAKALEIALTSRSKDKDGTPVPMCGVPWHAANGYIARLVRQSFRVALCEQMEDPRTTKGVVKREVVRVVTPATQLEAEALAAAETSFVMAVDPGPDSLGVAWLEPTTGEFGVAEWDGASRFERLRDELGVT